MDIISGEGFLSAFPNRTRVVYMCSLVASRNNWMCRIQKLCCL